MPDDLLGPLADGPLPPLSPAAAVRRRGEQRRRRGAAALAGAAVLALALGAGAASTLLGGDDRDALQADPGPNVTTAPSAQPPPTPAETPAPAARPVDGLLLGLADVEAAEPGNWAAGEPGVDPTLLDPCTGGTAYPRDADRVAGGITAWSSTREAGGTSVVQSVARYVSAEAARDALDGYERAVRGCPAEEEPDPQLPGSRRTHEVAEELSDVGGARTLYVRSEATCDTCGSGYVYYAVQQVADVVSVLRVAVGEDGDPRVDLVRPFAREAARRLAAG